MHSLLAEVYAEELTPGSTVLDLCSSVHSHLPPSSLLPIDQLTGHGMNDAELLANPRLDRHFLMDINAAGKHVQLPLSNAEVRRPKHRQLNYTKQAPECWCRASKRPTSTVTGGVTCMR